jgi:hypothetical protein
MEVTVELSPEERMEMMLNVMERVYGKVLEASDLSALLPLSDPLPGQAQELPILPDQRRSLLLPTIIDSRLRNPTPTVQELVDRISPLPELSAVMGICPDGLPLLFDLADPHPGSMLVASSHPDDFAGLFQAVLISAACLNSTQQVRYSVISEKTHRYQVAGGEQHCLGLYASWERAALEHIIACTEVAEQRRTGREMGAIHVLVIDNLEALLRTRSYDLEINLKWLARNGARSGFWVLAGLDSQTERSLPAGLIAEFKTMIYGRLDHEQRFRKVNPAPRQAFEISAGEFVTRLGSQWVQFSPLEVF